MFLMPDRRKHVYFVQVSICIYKSMTKRTSPLSFFLSFFLIYLFFLSTEDFLSHHYTHLPFRFPSSWLSFPSFCRSILLSFLLQHRLFWPSSSFLSFFLSFFLSHIILKIFAPNHSNIYLFYQPLLPSFCHSIYRSIFLYLSLSVTSLFFSS